eukprot:3358584-Rhodomonas_salina.3
MRLGISVQQTSTNVHHVQDPVSDVDHLLPSQQQQVSRQDHGADTEGHRTRLEVKEVAGEHHLRSVRLGSSKMGQFDVGVCLKIAVGH